MAVARNGELDRVSGGGFRVPISHGDSATGGAGDDERERRGYFESDGEREDAGVPHAEHRRVELRGERDAAVAGDRADERTGGAEFYADMAHTRREREHAETRRCG